MYGFFIDVSTIDIYPQKYGNSQKRLHWTENAMCPQFENTNIWSLEKMTPTSSRRNHWRAMNKKLKLFPHLEKLAIKLDFAILHLK